jgi:hypothetical protein
MVKPAAHDSFYKCSTHFSLILKNYKFLIIFNPSAGKGRQA